MTSLFISYSRKDIETARKLTEVFNGQELDFWIDWEGIPPTVDWWREIEKGIEEADIFLFLLSPDSAGSKVCKKEIEHAAQNGKRLIPVVIRDVKADDAPSEFRPLNWIFLRDNDDFNTGFDKLITAIKTDYEWVQIHRQLQVKALEWERNNHENDFLLHGKELQDTEIHLVANSSKEPHPTDLQREYVLKSRKITDKQRRTLTSATTAGLVIVAALAVYGFVQAGFARSAQATAVANAETAQAVSTVAVERANIAIARNAAIQSISMRNEQLDLSLLLGLEANRRLNNYETQGVLFDNLRFAPDIIQFQKGQNPPINDRLEILRELAGVEFPVVAISPDGRIGATGSERTIQLWDMASQKMIGELSLPILDPYISLRVLAFSPDSKKLASGTDSGELEIWDIARQEVIAGPVFVEDYVTSISFSNSGDYIAVGQSTNSIIGIYDVALPSLDPGSSQPWAEAIAQMLTGNHNDAINQILFSPDDRLLASGDAQGTVVLWEWERYGYGITKVFSGHTDAVVALTFENDGKTLVSTDITGTQIHWAVEAQNPLEKTFVTTTFLGASRISPDGTIFAFESLPGQVVLLDIETLQGMSELNSRNIYLSIDYQPEDSEYIITDDQFLGFDPTGRVLTYAPETGEFTLWDIVSRQPISSSIKPQTGVTCASFSMDGAMLAIGHDDGRIILWDMKSNANVGTLEGHSDSVINVEFASTGNLLVSSGADQRVFLWDIIIKQPLQPVLESNGILDISPDGKMLAYGDIDGIPLLFDLTRYEVIGAPLNGHRNVHGLSFNGDGTILASSGSDSTRISSDPSYNNVILWDVSSQRQIGQTIRSSIEGGDVTAFTGIHGMFSPEGGTFIVIDNLGNITLWDINVASWIDRNCQIVGRNFTQAEWSAYFPGEEYHKTCEQWPMGSK